MDAQVGDRMIVNGPVVGKPPRTGEIIECLDEHGITPHFRVRWSDGHESVVYPGADARVEPAESDGSSDEHGPERRTVRIEVRLEEDSDHCEATAILRTSLGELTATGRARRNPVDPEVPMIGEELAIARALGQLASTLEASARDAMDAREDRPLHLV